MKKISRYMIASLLGIAVGVTGSVFFSKKYPKKNVDRFQGEYQLQFMDFDELISISDNIIKGVVTKIVSSKGEYEEYDVRVLDTIKGEKLDSIVIRDYNLKTNSKEDDIENSNKKYEENGEYIFMTESINNVYEQYNTIIGDVYIDINNSKENSYYNLPLKISDVENYIKSSDKLTETSIYKMSQTAYLDGGDHSESELFEFCDVAVKIETLSLDNSNRLTDVYKCKIIDVLKGTICPGEEINIPFFKNTSNPFAEYVVYLMKTAEGSRLYSLAAPDAVR
ncbi:MAG: hypothetical protein IKO30_00690 [Lachnospiraceae bacterium]|nr:hypothetical protein [Lachnospiraceae bacterium]